MRCKILMIGAVSVLMTACMPVRPSGEAYWQRVEHDSALYMTGPKAQQDLDQSIARCVREIDELVRLEALRETLPPDTHSEYRRGLRASGDLDYFDTPTRLGRKRVAHTDFHDFESCMRHKGWERVRFVRYQTQQSAQKTYRATQQVRKYGVSGAQAEAIASENTHKDDFQTLNK